MFSGHFPHIYGLIWNNDAKSKFCYNNSSFIRQFYLTIWVGPDFNFQKVNWQPDTVNWSKLEIVLYTLSQLSCPTIVTELYCTDSTFVLCSSQFTRLMWTKMAWSSLLYMFKLNGYPCICYTVTVHNSRAPWWALVFIIGTSFHHWY